MENEKAKVPGFEIRLHCVMEFVAVLASSPENEASRMSENGKCISILKCRPENSHLDCSCLSLESRLMYIPKRHGQTRD